MNALEKATIGLCALSTASLFGMVYNGVIRENPYEETPQVVEYKISERLLSKVEEIDLPDPKYSIREQIEDIKYSFAEKVEHLENTKEVKNYKEWIDNRNTANFILYMSTFISLSFGSILNSLSKNRKEKKRRESQNYSTANT